MVDVLCAADAKRDPAGIRNPGVSFRKAFVEEGIVDRAWEGNVNDPAPMDMSDFCASETEFLSTEAVWMLRNMRPDGDFVRELLQVRHGRRVILCLISMTEYAGSILREKSRWPSFLMRPTEPSE